MNTNVNICMLAYSFYETDGRIRKYAETLSKKGIKVDVVALRNPEQTYFDILNGVYLYRIQERILDEKHKLSFLYRLVKFFIKSSLFLIKNHRKNPYDIIHVHSVPDFEVFATLYSKILGSKVILDIHDPVPDFFSAKFGYKNSSVYFRALQLIEKYSSFYADHVITVTDYWRDVIKRRSQIPNGKITTIVNFPDIELFNPNTTPAARRSDDDFILLYPGTLNKHCGVDIVITALSTIKEEIPNIKLRIYGNGSELRKLQSLVAYYALEKFVTFNTPIPLQDVPVVMKDSDVGIALLTGTSTYSNQALNVKLFEFLAMGLPAIATKAASIEYYLGNNVAMLSNVNDQEDVARCIRELYRNPGKREELKKAGLKYIEKNNWQSQIDTYMNIINSLLEKTD
ncbi:MAG TPA: glycosyltransferase WbuB [Candidatus Marinimicrobia bacterium]|nr:glycosyltransferase WbuB [Candidatus Neomarinimicrobiota bacterium]